MSCLLPSKTLNLKTNTMKNPYIPLKSSFFQQIKASIPKLSQLTNTLIIHVF